jgi:hypothetical protein
MQIVSNVSILGLEMYQCDQINIFGERKHTYCERGCMWEKCLRELIIELI